MGSAGPLDLPWDIRNGFLPPNPPLRRLPGSYDAWANLYEKGIAGRFSPAHGVHDPKLREVEMLGGGKWNGER